MADVRVAPLMVAATLALGMATAVAQAPGTPAPGPASPAPPAAGSPSAANVDEATERYLRDAARQDRIAIETSRLVLERSSRTAVRETAKKVLDERTKAQHRLTTAASVQSLGMRPDKTAADAGDEEVEALRQTAPEGIDRAYLRISIENHEAALKLQEDYGREGANDALRSQAMASAMVIEARLNDLRRLNQELGGGAS